MPASDAHSDRLAATIAAPSDVAYVWELDGDGIEWSGRLWCDGVDVTAGIASGRGLAGRIHPDDISQRQASLANHFDSAREFDCAYRLRDGDGRAAWVRERGGVVRDADGRPRRMLGVIRMLHDRPQTRLEPSADYDELTGHFNKTRLREAVDQVIAAHDRTASPAAFLSVGIDNMKAINDAVGLAAGDAVLIEIGRRLDSCVRVSDQVGRLGGDRFGVLLAHCPADHVAAAAAKIVAVVNATPVATASGPVCATVSVGGAAFPDQALTSYDVITRAEAALAEAKHAGRDCYRHYRTSQAERDRRRRLRTIGEEVRAALRDERMMFSYQPIVSAATGAVDYYEALLCLRDLDGRLVGAGEFVPAVEQLGLVRLVDRYVLDRTIEEVARHPGVVLGFNISGLTAADRAWRRALLAQLRDRPELAARLVVEITETAALYDIEEAARFVAGLRQTGCRVALDDFGAGHSSLRYLQSLPVDTVKVAGSFTGNIAASPDSRVFLRHLLHLAEGFGFRTVAEGVETAEDAAILKREGVGYLQGYYYGRPSFTRPWLNERAIASSSALTA